MPSPSDRRPLLWSMFIVSALAAIGLFFIPAFIIRPFTHQSAAGIAWAMAIREWAPWGTLIAAIVCLVFALVLWCGSMVSGSKWRDRSRKTVLALAMLVVAFSAVMSRINYFEWMFHPIEQLRFDTEEQSKLDKNEMILAVRFSNDARAYPISQMAYHHVVNDVVAGVPIAVTY
jgi:uncharacterized membrane protein YhaH (DUF805 family)